MAANALAGLSVLVLEDEYLIAMDVEQICSDHGAENVIIKRRVTELDDQIWSEKFDVALLDVMLDGQPTLPFARVLQERNIPFIFASGYTDLEALLAEFPSVGFIGKPYSESALVKSILDALRASGR